MSEPLLMRLFMAQVASCGCMTKTPEVSYHKEDCRYRILNEAHRRIELLESALRFYASGAHFFGDKDTWDTVSDEPQNFWCNEAGDATVEDGSIAKKFLLGHWQDWGGHEAPDLLPEERAAPETRPLRVEPHPECPKCKLFTDMCVCKPSADWPRDANGSPTPAPSCRICHDLGPEYLPVLCDKHEAEFTAWKAERASGSAVVEMAAVPQSTAKAVFNECECDWQIQRYCKFNTPAVPCDCLCHTLNR